MLLLIWPLAASGEEPVRLDVEIGESGRAYRDAVWGVDTEVEYYDPAAPAPEMTTTEPIRLDGDDADIDNVQVTGAPRIIISVVVIAILVAVVIAIARLSGVSTASFSRAPDRGARAARRSGGDTEESMPTSLSAIADIRDRRIALILLTTQAMQAAAAQCGFRIGRSWTLRDVIRRVPRDWRHHGALSTLARTAEAVHFGGRDVAEDEFQTHFAAARAIVGA